MPYPPVTSMPAIAEILCQRCGARTEAVTLRACASVTPCLCGGVRQVVRITPSQRRAFGQPRARPTCCVAYQPRDGRVKLVATHP
jgi:hypothetical protein